MRRNVSRGGNRALAVGKNPKVKPATDPSIILNGAMADVKHAANAAVQRLLVAERCRQLRKASRFALGSIGRNQVRCRRPANRKRITRAAGRQPFPLPVTADVLHW